MWDTGGTLAFGRRGKFELVAFVVDQRKKDKKRRRSEEDEKDKADLSLKPNHPKPAKTER